MAEQWINRAPVRLESLTYFAFKDETMKRMLLYGAGVLMTVGGLIIGCAHDRCGSGGCPRGQTYAPSGGPGPSAMPQGSGSPQYGTSDGGVPTYTTPAPSYSTPAPGSGGFGGSGSR
jgi:hypothetical protein